MLSLRAQSATSLTPLKLFKEVTSNQYCAASNPNGFVNLGVAESTLMHDELVAHLKGKFNPPSCALSYGSGPGGSLRLRTAIARFFNRYFAPVRPVEPHHLNVSNGVTASIERCAFEIGDPGDMFLLGRPHYGSYPSDIGDRAGIRTIPVCFGSVDPLSIAAVECYAEALKDVRNDPRAGGTVRALLLCSPHNPLGQCYPRSTLEALMRFCQREQIHLISDEVYALSVFENPTMPDAEDFTSVLAIETENLIDAALVHVLWGLSKDFGANGMRIGCVVSQANQSLIEVLDTHAAYSYPSTMLEYMACCILEDGCFLDTYIRENRRRLTRNYLLISSFLENHGIPFRASINAGMFVWVDIGEALRRRKPRRLARSVVGSCSREAFEDQPLAAFTRERGHFSLTDAEIMMSLVAHRVFIASGDSFGSENAGWFRIVFSQSDQVLLEGLTRIVTALGLEIASDVQVRHDLSCPSK